MLAADIDADLVRLIVEAVVALELGLDRGLEFGRAVDIGIFGRTLADSLDRCVLHEIGRVEIGLARGQADNVDTLCLQVQHPAGHGKRGGGLNAVQRGRSGAHRDLLYVRCSAPIAV